MDVRNAYDENEIARSEVTHRLILLAKARSAKMYSADEESQVFTELLNLVSAPLDAIEYVIEVLDARAEGLISDEKSTPAEKMLIMTILAEEQATMLMEM